MKKIGFIAPPRATTNYSIFFDGEFRLYKEWNEWTPNGLKHHKQLQAKFPDLYSVLKQIEVQL